MEKSTANKAASTGRPSTYKFRLFIDYRVINVLRCLRGNESTTTEVQIGTRKLLKQLQVRL